MQTQPLRMRRDYGETQGEVNPFLNTSPTEIVRLLKKEKSPAKKRQMQQALRAWRKTVPGPFWKSQTNIAKKIAKEVVCMERLFASLTRI